MGTLPNQPEQKNTGYIRSPEDLKGEVRSQLKNLQGEIEGLQKEATLPEQASTPEGKAVAFQNLAKSVSTMKSNLNDRIRSLEQLFVGNNDALGRLKVFENDSLVNINSILESANINEKTKILEGLKSLQDRLVDETNDNTVEISDPSGKKTNVNSLEKYLQDAVVRQQKDEFLSPSAQLTQEAGEKKNSKITTLYDFYLKIMELYHRWELKFAPPEKREEVKKVLDGVRTARLQNIGVGGLRTQFSKQIEAQTNGKLTVDYGVGDETAFSKFQTIYLSEPDKDVDAVVRAIVSEYMSEVRFDSSAPEKKRVTLLNILNGISAETDTRTVTSVLGTSQDVPSMEGYKISVVGSTISVTDPAGKEGSVRVVGGLAGGRTDKLKDMGLNFEKAEMISDPANTTFNAMIAYKMPSVSSGLSSVMNLVGGQMGIPEALPLSFSNAELKQVLTQIANGDETSLDSLGAKMMARLAIPEMIPGMRPVIKFEKVA